MAAGIGAQEISESVSSARAARLRYVTDEQPGIRRRRVGRGFSYVDSDGARVTDDEVITRINSLAIPPAWKDVWICPHPNGHIQASGRDVRGRKQYRYHERWTAVRDETKFERTIAFGRSLPALRRRIDEHLTLPGLPRDKVISTVVCLLESTLIRVGNDDYARQNGSVGLTTMRNRHVSIDGSRLRFSFRGKGGIWHIVEVDDRRLARLVRRCQELPGEELFQYVDESGEQRAVHSEDVNEYLRAACGEEFTAKDFRTWAGTVLAAEALRQMLEIEPEARTNASVVRVVEDVAQHLGNTPTVCRRCYIHPDVIDAFLDGSLVAGDAGQIRTVAGLRPEEAWVLGLLRRRRTRLNRAAMTTTVRQGT
jgi:DNA topoisomerase-1